MMEPIIKTYMTELNAQMEEEILKVCHSYGIDVNKERLMQALTDARKFYDEGYRAGKLDAGPKWISVEERLPELIPCNAGTAYSEAVIVWTNGRKAMVAVWDGIDFLCAADYWEAWGEKITHWMPLPELPKEV